MGHVDKGPLPAVGYELIESFMKGVDAVDDKVDGR